LCHCELFLDRDIMCLKYYIYIKGEPGNWSIIFMTNDDAMLSPHFIIWALHPGYKYINSTAANDIKSYFKYHLFVYLFLLIQLTAQWPLGNHLFILFNDN